MPTIVSIIIPAYNQAHYLAAAVQSALDQTYPHFEVLIINDGSTDNTEQVAQSFTDPRVRYISQQNRGLSGARNTGIRNATGSLLTYLDSDDLFLPEKLAWMVAEFETQPELGFLAGQAQPIDEHNQPVGALFDRPIPAESAMLLLGNPLHVGAVMVRRAWQEQAGFFDETLRSYEDWDMWLRLARLGCKLGWLPKPVSLYRFHTAQMTRIGKQMTTATFAVLDKVFANPDLPPAWLAIKDHAYSNAHLRAAAQAYHAQDFESARANLEKAVRLNPQLTEYGGDRLANQFAGWLDLPKITNPLEHLEMIYANLPGTLTEMSSRRNRDLGKFAMQLAFKAFASQDLPAARRLARKAIRYQPGWLLNRGALSILLRTMFLTEPRPT